MIIRIKGYPTVCNHFDRKQEAEDWANDVERQIKLSKFNFNQHKATVHILPSSSTVTLMMVPWSLSGQSDECQTSPQLLEDSGFRKLRANSPNC